jgi:hypothetical protein
MILVLACITTLRRTTLFAPRTDPGRQPYLVGLKVTRPGLSTISTPNEMVPV